MCIRDRDNIELHQKVQDFEKAEIVREHSVGLVDTDAEKLASLVEDIDYDNRENFEVKVKTVKEAHFSNEPSGSDEIISEETEGESDELIESNSSMDRYVSTLRKTQPKS